MSFLTGLTKVGDVGNQTLTSIVYPPITSGSAYAVGNAVGPLLNFQNTFLGVGSGLLQSAVLICRDTQTTSFNLLLFTTQPTSTTFTDRTTPTINATDQFSCGPIITFTNPVSVGGVTVYTVPSIGCSMLVGAKNVYGVLFSGGTPTFGSTQDIAIKLTALAD